MPIRCSVCSLSSAVPGVDIDATGVCKSCREFDEHAHADSLNRARDELTAMIEQVKASFMDDAANGPKADYHCIVALSGGKDSCFTLKLMVEQFGLRCLAVTIDNGFLSLQSIENSRLLCGQLGVDFLLLRPNTSFMKSLYRTSIEGRNANIGAIKRASDLCNGCINLINSIMLKEAVHRNVPIIAGGYISGQVPKGSCVLKMRMETLLMFAQQKAKQSGPAMDQYRISKADVGRFNNGNTLYIVNPMLSFRYDQDVVVHELSKMGWKRSNDTGMHSSNCRINDFGIKVHMDKYGFHPYELEVADQVRAGTLSRAAAIEKLEAPLDMERIEEMERSIAANVRGQDARKS